MPRAVVLAAGSAALGLLATLLVITSPYLLFGYHNPSLHLVLDSIDAFIALLVAYLLLGRFQRESRIQDLCLVCGLTLLALASLAAGVVTTVVDDVQALTLEVWLPQAFRAGGALMIAIGGLAGGRLASPRSTRLALGAASLGVVLLSSVLVLARDFLPVAVTETPESAVHPLIDGHPSLLLAHTFGALCFLLAAALFTGRALRGHDELLSWLGAAFVLAAFSRVHYMLFPSIYSGWLYTGDLFRTGCYLLLLVGATREISRYWSDQTRLAVLEDRKRLARELHDGVVQELGYIRAEARALGVEDAVRQRIVDSADRGIDEARAAIDTLGHGGDESLGFMLHRAARQVAERYGGKLVVDLDVSIDVTQAQGHALVRITREAVSNAIRHGGADNIGIGLFRDPAGCRLVVHDDGHGFDPTTLVDATGYGLTSMRERAANLPGSFDISSAAGRGTTVVVTW